MKNIYTYAMLIVPALLAGKTAIGQPGWIDDSLDEVDVELGEQDLKVMINNVIKIALGFLGLIATSIILLGGFKWMTSQGNTDKVDEAKKLLKAGIVGLIIIFAAYAITAFVMRTAFEASNEEMV